MPIIVDAAGVQVKNLTEIIADISARLTASINPNLRFEPGGVLKNVVDAVALEALSLNEGLLAVANFLNRNTAEGASLDNLGFIVGVPRLLATRSTGIITATGVSMTLIPADSKVRVPEGPIFRTTADAAIGGGGTVDIAIESVELGAIAAQDTSITEIVDGVIGWTSVTNADDVTPGREIEDDFDYRARQPTALQRGTTATDQGIRAAVEDVDNVLAVTVRSNRELTTDGDGIPGKSFRPVVFPPGVVEADVALAIWDTMPAGIRADGSDHAVDITDDQGYTQTIRYDDALALELHLEIDVVRDPLTFPEDGEDQIRTLVDDVGAALSVAEDFRPLILACLILELGGVDDVEIRVGTAPSPTQTTTFAIDLGEIAEFDSAAPAGGRTTIALLP